LALKEENLDDTKKHRDCAKNILEKKRNWRVRRREFLRHLWGVLLKKRQVKKRRMGDQKKRVTKKRLKKLGEKKTF